MLLRGLLKIRYLFVIAVFFLLVNAIIFIIAGAVECIRGYNEFTQAGFQSSDDIRPGTHLLEGLDFFVSALVFMIFGLGLGQLFLIDKDFSVYIPRVLRISTLKELKIILWETILVALVIFCVTHLLRNDLHSWDILPFPVLILVLSLALFLVKFDKISTRKSE